MQVIAWAFCMGHFFGLATAWGLECKNFVTTPSRTDSRPLVCLFFCVSESMFSFYASEWRRLLQGFGGETRSLLAQIANTQNEALANYFYSAMLEDEAASSLLSHEQVQARLMGSMQRWIVQVLASTDSDDLEALIAQQVKVGEVHARIDVPVHLVLRGARRLKEGLHQTLMQEDPELQASVLQLACSLIDQAMEAMSQGYAVSRDGSSRSKEAYRLFTATQNLATVREQRRAELLDWENQCLYLHAMGGGSQPLSNLATSDFGLWFRHKGVDMFHGAPAAHSIAQAMAHIDQHLLPALMQAKSADIATPLLQLREHARHIGMSLESLFTQNSELDAGRDVLTQLLNRKFLPVVLSKEVQYARQSASAFSVLTVDIDHFKQINDRYGHEGGDVVLQQVAAVLNNNIRGGDYLFRLGGEEFLMVLVDTSSVGAVNVAEKLRAQIAREVFHLPGNQKSTVTISTGVATFDGHPDYQRILRQSDEALYRAKAQGRNCVVIA